MRAIPAAYGPELIEACCETIRAKELTTLDAVRAHTKASASCGSCTAKVEAILAHLGGAVAHREDPALCKCTEHGHDAVARSRASSTSDWPIR